VWGGGASPAPRLLCHRLKSGSGARSWSDAPEMRPLILADPMCIRELAQPHRMRLFIFFALVVRGCYSTLLVMLRSKKRIVPGAAFAQALYYFRESSMS
jgi:hypothetical protein